VILGSGSNCPAARPFGTARWPLNGSQLRGADGARFMRRDAWGWSESARSRVTISRLRPPTHVTNRVGRLHPHGPVVEKKKNQPTGRRKGVIVNACRGGAKAAVRPVSLRTYCVRVDKTIPFPGVPAQGVRNVSRFFRSLRSKAGAQARERIRRSRARKSGKSR